MSECVVRMEMPENCKKCKSTFCLWTIADCEIMDTIAAVQDFRKKNDDGFPVFCPIICSLPEGHGRLVDADALVGVLGIMGDKGGDPVVWMQMRYIAEDMTTIVPAERSET